MLKNITGAERTNDQMREDVKTFKQLMKQNQLTLQQASKERKIQRHLQNQQLLDKHREQEEINKYKFSKLSKKPPFLTKVHQKGVFKETVEVHDAFRDYTKKHNLIVPDRTLKSSAKWKTLNTIQANFFGSVPKNILGKKGETRADYFDEHHRKLKELETRDFKNSIDGRIKRESLTMRSLSQPKCWMTNCLSGDFFDYSPGLNDGTHTPRSRKKHINLDRVYDHKKWVPSNPHSHEFTLAQRKTYSSKLS